MKKITDSKHVNILTWLCVGVYFVSYITRINYAAVISAFVVSEHISKATASIAVTGLFITYGFGQLISGYLGDRLKPKHIILGGLLVTSLMNILMPLNTNTIYMTAIWCINGFAQAMLWPPMVKILTNYLNGPDYTKACVKVSWGSSFGTIAIYLLASLFIAVSGWRTIFYFSAAIGILGAIVWVIFMKKIECYAETNGVEEGDIPLAKTEGHLQFNRTVVFILTLMMLGIILQGILRDGITTWMPSYIIETFHLGTSVAILTSVILPIFSIISFQVATIIYARYFHNELTCAGVIFAVGAVSAFILAIFSGSNAGVSVFFSMIITGCMNGVNIILVCMVPKRFEKYGNISTISGVLNFATYIGSALSTYGFAILSEHLGWQLTIVSWGIIAALGMIICFLGVKKWYRFYHN